MSSRAALARRLALPAGPLAALATGAALLAAGHGQDAAVTAGIAVLCVVWWIFEPIPIPATAFVPFTVLPLAGVITADQLAGAYGHPLILLLMGGFILSTAMARNGAHRRIALTMVRWTGGGSSRRLVIGFMLAAASLSMWISNTATTLMLLPVALAVLDQAEDRELAAPLLLGIAYAANIGGLGTPIGTPPNVIFMGVYHEVTGEEVTFLTWMRWGVPAVLLFLPVLALWLTRNLSWRGDVVMPRLGPWRAPERRVLIVFALTALAWVTRKEPFGGWHALLDLPYSNDAIVAFAGVIALFLVPDGEGERLLDWETAVKIPWGMLLLFASGIAIAAAFTSSGLSTAIGTALSGAAALPLVLLLLTICLVVTFMTEATSNTATTTLLMPIMAAAALGVGADPKLFMVPAAMSASCAFMLPVATAPNVIMFGTDRFPLSRMLREGVVLNLAGAAIITAVCLALVR